MRAAAPLLVFLLAVGGCATMESGTDFDMATAHSFKAGESTRADIERALGPPSSVTEASDGSSMLVYVHIESEANSFSGKSSARSRSVAYTFTPDGVLKDFTKQSNSTQANN